MLRHCVILLAASVAMMSCSSLESQNYVAADPEDPLTAEKATLIEVQQVLKKEQETAAAAAASVPVEMPKFVYYVRDEVKANVAADATSATAIAFTKGQPVMGEAQGAWLKISDGVWLPMAAVSDKMIPSHRQEDASWHEDGSAIATLKIPD